MPAASDAARELGKRVLAKRESLGLTQMQAAERAKMDQANYGRIERGTGNPTLASIIRIAVGFGIDPGELVAGMDDSLLPSKPHTATVRVRRDA